VAETAKRAALKSSTILRGWIRHQSPSSPFLLQLS